MKLLLSAASAFLLAWPTLVPAQTSSPDGRIVGVDPLAAVDHEAEAWSQLEAALASHHVDTRVQALSALSLLGGNARAEGMVRRAMEDTTEDIDVRVAAIVAAGQMDRDRPTHGAFGPELHQLLGTADPKLSFTAAMALWSMHDRGGEEVLKATAEGERAGDYSFMKRSQHNASRTLHSPEALAKIAVLQSLTIFVPPVGMGMGAYGYLKGDPGQSPQVTAIEALGKTHTPDVQEALIEASRTKSDGARIAAAEALSRFSGAAVREALVPLMEDSKTQVQLTGSAAFLRVVLGRPRHPDARLGR